MLVGGFLLAISGTPRAFFARLNTDGTLDAPFQDAQAGPVFGVHAIVPQPDGRLLIGGSFYHVHGASGGKIARLNADGSLDSSFMNGQSGADIHVNAIALQPDGRILIGGDFLTVNGVSRNHLARLNADGTLDATFPDVLAGSSGEVHAIVLQPDGRALIAGGLGSRA